jgi:hypothetical protein
MCKLCQDILGDLALPHDESKCPLQKSYYCSTCAKYGHLTDKCPAKPSTYFTEPCFIEQLIPPTLMKEYNITSRTPIPLIKKEEAPRLLEIMDDDRVIAAYLSARSIKSKNKRHALEEYARQKNMRVVYMK